MTHFEFIHTKEQEQALLKRNLEHLEGRKAVLDPHVQEYKLLSASIKETQQQLSHLELEIDQFILNNS